MLPVIQFGEHLFPVPKFDLVKGSVKKFISEFNGFHEQFADCFQRSESRDHFFNYMLGQFRSLGSRSKRSIALSAEDGNVRSMQRFVSDASWDDGKMIEKYRRLVNHDLGSDAGALIFDERGFPKKGQNSIGVARQYNAMTGIVENCQVGVFAAYVSEHGYALVDKQLFIPQKWFSSDYRDLRAKCKLPADTVFRPKPQLAVAMLDAVAKENSLPFKYVIAESECGISPELINAVEALEDKIYFVSVAKDTPCRLKRPMAITRQYTWGGKTRTKTVWVDPQSKPLLMEELARNINDYFWYRREIPAGTKGAVAYEFSRCRVILETAGLSPKTVWLLIRRTLDDNPTYRFFVSNAANETRLETLIWLSGLRWAIEQCFEETRTELGMEQYEVRKYTGWHHHMIACMLAHFFLWHLKIRLGKKSTVYYTITD